MNRYHIYEVWYAAKCQQKQGGRRLAASKHVCKQGQFHNPFCKCFMRREMCFACLFKDTHCAFWWKTLDVNMTSVCLQENPKVHHWGFLVNKQKQTYILWHHQSTYVNASTTPWGKNIQRWVKYRLINSKGEVKEDREDDGKKVKNEREVRSLI